MKNSGVNIVKHLYESGQIQENCSKVCPDKYLCDDLIQEVTLILMSKPDDVLVGLYERAECSRYIYKVAKNQFNSTTSPFFKQYKEFLNRSKDGN